MKRLIIIPLALAAIVLAWPTTAAAQSLESRIESLQKRQMAKRLAVRHRVAQRVNRPVALLEFSATPAEDALRKISLASGVNIVINWRAMELEGISRDTPIDITLADTPAIRAISLVCDQMSPEQELIAEVDEHFVRIMTKAQANRRAYVRVYPIHDLMQTVPNYTDAPAFDLSAISQSAADGGVDIFGGDTGDETEFISEREKAEQVMDLIRQTIEPDIWQVNGGLAGSIRYYNGNLIIRAPSYVHARIDIPGASMNAGGPRAAAPGKTNKALAGSTQPRGIPSKAATRGPAADPTTDAAGDRALAESDRDRKKPEATADRKPLKRAIR